MRIWLDMANSPHPVLLGPVSRALEARGHEVVVTARDHAQTRALTLERWPDAVFVGGESPGGRASKARAIAERVALLRRSVGGKRIDAAASLGSYAQLVASRTLGIPALTLMDYEYQPANHLSFRLARRVVVPDVFPRAQLRRFGAREERIARFEGFKEEFYLDRCDEGTPRRRDGRTRVVFRPPPDGALYHRSGNSSFDKVLAYALERDEIEVVVLPRMAGQRERYASMPGVQVPDRVVDGLGLLSSADLFIGAGGTMSREAALLGVRAYTMFAGRLASVDSALMQRGMLHDLRSEPPSSVDWTPRSADAAAAARDRRRERGESLRAWLVSRIEELGRER